MAKLFMVRGLPYVSVTLRAGGKSLSLARALVDTGSGACVFKTDDLEQLDIRPQLTDRLRTMSGIGGIERVVEKQIDAIEIDDLSANPFTIQLGALEYGLPIDGIIGADFLLATRAVIDFDALEIRPKTPR